MAKSTSGSGWRQKSNGFLASIAAVTLIVVLLGGMGIGYAIEKSRVKTTPKTALKKNVAAKKVAVQAVRVGGTVELTSANSITVTPKKGAKRTIAITKATVFLKAGSGAARDIAAAHKVLFIGAGSYTKAKAVIVLAMNSKLGTVVSAADGSTMSLQTGKKVTKITTTGATVNTTAAATLADVAKGSKVLVAAVRTKAGLTIATEIIVLPSDTLFV